MLQKIKIFFSPFLGKRYLLIALLLIAGGTLLPFAFAHAWLGRLGMIVVSLLVSFFLGLAGFAALALANLGDMMLRWVVIGGWTNIPYTIGNPLVMYGWEIVRDFVNMFFILVLVIIGLATALRIPAYQWQRTLPRLIFVALLINFSPVLLGMVIDFSNILMNHFLTNVPGHSYFVTRSGAYSSTIWSMIWNMSISAEGIVDAIATPLAVLGSFVAMNFLSFLTSLLFALLFALRHIALWMLVILSPLGFFCYILPATQGFAQQWAKQFIQWCVVGIAGAFFLYLGEWTLMHATDLVGAGPRAMHGVDPRALDELFILFVPVGFLLMGFFATLGTSAMGASAITSRVHGKTKQYLGRYYNYRKRRVGQKVKDNRAVRWGTDKASRGLNKVGDSKIPGISRAFKDAGRGINRWQRRQEQDMAKRAGEAGRDYKTRREQQVTDKQDREKAEDKAKEEDTLKDWSKAAAKGSKEGIEKVFKKIESAIEEQMKQQAKANKLWKQAQQARDAGDDETYNRKAEQAKSAQREASEKEREVNQAQKSIDKGASRQKRADFRWERRRIEKEQKKKRQINP